MRAPLSWIRDFTPVDADPSPTSSSALNQLGLEVEGVEQPGEEITGVDRGAGARRRAAPERRQALARRHHDSATARPGWCAARPTSWRAWWCRTRPSGATLPGWLHARTAQDPRRGERRHAVLGARSSASATTTPASSGSIPTHRARRRRARGARPRRRDLRPRDHAQPARRDVHRRRGPRARRALLARLRAARRRSPRPTRR